MAEVIESTIRTSDSLVVGEVYSRADLKGRFQISDATIKTGVFSPKGHASVWLFITESKTADRTQFEDLLEGNTLYWQGQLSGRSDALIIEHEGRELEIVVFYRRSKKEHPHAAFRYEGRFRYHSHSGTGPTSFVLVRDDSEPFEPASVRARTLRARPVEGGTLEVRLVDAVGGDPDMVRRVSPAGAFDLLTCARHSSSREVPFFIWEGQDVDLNDESRRTLAWISSWLVSDALGAAGLRYEDVFDLSAYSDRVIGFEGRITVVPFVARKQGGQGWIPEDIEIGVVVSGSGETPARVVRLTADQLEALADALQQARARGETTLTLPGSDVVVTVEEAGSWFTPLQQIYDAARSGTLTPRAAKAPTASPERPVLQVLHNVDSLEYGSRDLVAPVPAGARAERPAALRREIQLLPHQDAGIAWLQHRFGQQAQGLRGCLLADDMGLGKTMQTLCLIAWMLERNPDAPPSLIVAPVALLENWKAEIDKFLDGRQGRVLSLYGQRLQECALSVQALEPQLRESSLKKKLLRPDFATGCSVVLTTYETLRDYQFSLARIHWGVVVCDEAQKIKNPAAYVTRAAKALRADFKIACTGTPVENSLADLWCLFDFFQPGLLGSLKEFSRAYRTAIEGRQAGYEALTETLRTRIQPWVLRRMKEEVAKDLKPKIQGELAAPGHMALPMTALQWSLYAQTAKALRETMKSQDADARSATLGLLYRLRMICSNPASVAFDDWESRPAREHLVYSPKLAWLIRQLEQIKARGEKVILFTEYRDIQSLLQRTVAEVFSVTPEIVNGDTSVDASLDASRQRIIDAFQRAPGFHVIILSTSAVGFGVNIQEANHVVHFTRPWNPAKEDQATDRAYRIGQTRPVYVYYPSVVAEGLETFDQRVDALLTAKRSLSRDMLSGGHEITLRDFDSL